MIALLVGSSPTLGSEDLVARLAASHDVVIAIDGGAEVCARGGVVPDVIVGDFDSARPETVDAARRSGADVITFSAEKDETDLELGLRHARAIGANSVTLTAVSGGRLDHLLGVIAALRGSADLAPSLVEPESTAWVLTPTGRASQRIEGRGTVLSVLPLTGFACVSVAGVRWPLEESRLSDSEARGVSNVVTEAAASVDVLEGVVLVVVPRRDVALEGYCGDADTHGDDL